MKPACVGWLLLLLVAATSANAAMRIDVVGNGAARASGSARRIEGTVGQAMVGATAGGGRTLGVGFWGGVKSALITGVDLPRPGDGVPMRFSFGSATPSPTSSEASFALALPVASQVEMRIFDVSGRQVDALASRDLDPGEHVIRWRAANLGAGLYFARLVVNGRVRALRRVVLVR